MGAVIGDRESVVSRKCGRNQISWPARLGESNVSGATMRMSSELARFRQGAAGVGRKAWKRSISASIVGKLSGAGACGMSAAWASPDSRSWKEASSEKITRPDWNASQRRVVKLRPSRTLSTAKSMGMLGSPASTK